jgi:hypothetical protein
MSEAVIWGILTDCGVTIEPNADLVSGKMAPDFKCSKGEYEFYVEATCIRIETAAKKTDLPNPSVPGFRMYSNLNRAIFQECQNKAEQCGSVSSPCLLGIVTYHSEASALCFERDDLAEVLTGEQYMSFDFDTKRGCATGTHRSATKLDLAFPIKPAEGRIQEARASISGVLVAGMGCQPPNIRGLLHPQPKYSFEHRILNRLEFGYLVINHETGQMSVEWQQPSP